MSNDTITDNLELTVVNDGDGTQCGADYKHRCAVFKLFTPRAKAKEALRWVSEANSWMVVRGYETASAAELLYQAAKVVAYYEEHVKELAA